MNKYDLSYQDLHSSPTRDLLDLPIALIMVGSVVLVAFLIVVTYWRPVANLTWDDWTLLLSLVASYWRFALVVVIGALIVSWWWLHRERRYSPWEVER